MIPLAEGVAIETFLKGAGPFTVFALTDEAFAAVLKALGWCVSKPFPRKGLDTHHPCRTEKQTIKNLVSMLAGVFTVGPARGASGAAFGFQV